METKKPWQSKTVIIGTITGILSILAMWGILPGASEWVSSHGDIIGAVLSGGFLLARTINSNIVLKD